LLAQYNYLAFVGKVTFHKILIYQYGHYTLYLQKHHISIKKKCIIKQQYPPAFIFERYKEIENSRKQGRKLKKLPHPRPYQFQAISML